MWWSYCACASWPVLNCGIESKHIWLFSSVHKFILECTKYKMIILCMCQWTSVELWHWVQTHLTFQWRQGHLTGANAFVTAWKNHEAVYYVWKCCQHSGKGITLASLWMLSNQKDISDRNSVIPKCQYTWSPCCHCKVLGGQKIMKFMCVHFIHSLFVARKILKPSGFCSHIRDAVAAAAACTCGQRPSSHGEAACVKFWSFVLSSSKGAKTYLSTLAPRTLLSQNCGKSWGVSCSTPILLKAMHIILRLQHPRLFGFAAVYIIGKVWK